MALTPLLVSSVASIGSSGSTGEKYLYCTNTVPAVANNLIGESAERVQRERGWSGDTKGSLMREIVPAADHSTAKITVVGVGQVGMACAFSMLLQDVVSELCLIDVDENRLLGETMDLQHGLAFVKHCVIKSSTDYSVSADSKICVITAGVRQEPGESRLSLVQRNVVIFKKIIPQLVKYSPDTILFVVSNPVDIMTYVTWKLSGLPRERVFGSGTNLDSARFRFLMSERLCVSPASCHAWVIGEHGDSSVAVWSGINIAGVPLRNINPRLGEMTDSENWAIIHRKVVDRSPPFANVIVFVDYSWYKTSTPTPFFSAYEIIRKKGYTSWAIGLSVSAICSTVIRNSRDILAVSVNLKGFHGVENDVFLSLPSVLGANGVTHVVMQQLDEKEKAQMQASADAMRRVQQNLDL